MLITKEVSLFNEIDVFCQKLKSEFDLISVERKEKLDLLSKYIGEKHKDKLIPKIIVICTHNSRRSHIGQLWLAVGRDFFQLPEIATFSGGTEATALDHRVIKAFQRLGFQIISEDTPTDNPKYHIKWKDSMTSYEAFSKKYEDPPNPRFGFGAIMVCSQADEGCPLVLGCDFRLSLPFDDPKEYDGTSIEEEKYDETIRHIGREIFYVLSQL